MSRVNGRDPRKIKRTIRRLFGRGVTINPLLKVLKGNPLRGHQFTTGRRKKLQRAKRIAAHPISGGKSYAQTTNGKKHIMVQVERAGIWRTFAMFPISPEGEANARHYAKMAHRRFPKFNMRVVK